MKKLPFMGSGVALVTPFTEDNKIDYDSLSELIEMHIRHKTDAIVICGTTGEASTLTDDEQEAIIGFAVKFAAGRIPVIAGAGSNNTAALIEKAKRAENAGADAILSVTPFYNKANYSGVTAHYECLSHTVDIPIIIYNVPSRTGMSMPVDALERLSELDNIVGIKEASGNAAFVSKIRYSVPEIGVYSGNDDIVVPVMALGGVGVISVCANIFPDRVHEMCRLMLDGKTAEAAKLQNGLSEVNEKLFSEVNPIPVKSAMNTLGYRVGKTRLPLGKMDRKRFDDMMKVLYDYGAERLS